MKPTLAVLILLSLAACRGAGEFMGWTGSPQGDDGWSEDYAATPNDVWEAFRVVVRDNGSIIKEDPEAMYLRGEYRPADSTEWDGIEVKGNIYDRSTEDQLRTRLIVRAWYGRSANDRGRPHTAREYCNAVFRVLKAWQGEEVDEESRVATTSEEPVKEDEAIGFFAVTTDQAFDAALKVLKQYGEIGQEDRPGFIRATKDNALEGTEDDVRVNIYDRTEGESVRAKISVRVRRGEDNKALQNVAKSYVNEIRKELEKQFGPRE